MPNPDYNDPWNSPDESSLPSQPAKPLSEIEFHAASQSLATQLMHKITTESGALRTDVEIPQAAKVLALCRQVIESLNKARKDMQAVKQQNQFERAVLHAARSLPALAQEQFLSALEAAISDPDVIGE